MTDNKLSDYFFLNLGDGRGYMLPTTSQTAALQALNLYNAYGLKARVAKRVLATALQMRVAQPFLPRIRLGADDNTPPGLLQHICKALGRDDLCFGVSLGTPGPQRKPVLLVMDTQGNEIGYAKIGLDERTSNLVRNEQHALKTLSEHNLKHGQFPAVVHYSEWQDRSILITEPLHLQSGDATLTDLHLNFLLELATVDTVRVPLTQSPFWQRTQEALNRFQPIIGNHQHSVLSQVCNLLETQLGTTELPFVWRLGDFTPWNTGLDTTNNKLQAIDVEYAAAGSSPGWDMFHFLTLAHGNPMKAIYQTQHQAVGRYCTALDLATAHIPLLHMAYLLDIWFLWADVWDGKPASLRAIRGFRNRITALATLASQYKLGVFDE